MKKRKPGWAEQNMKDPEARLWYYIFAVEFAVDDLKTELEDFFSKRKPRRNKPVKSLFGGHQLSQQG